jgi:ubiquinone/menaquinone biosynthesis C-methylase UbiE
MVTNADVVAGHRRTSYELWERMAQPWEHRRELTWRSTRELSDWLVDRVDPKGGETVLELAAGTGETGFLAAERLGPGGSLISSDYSPQMVQAAERVGASLGVSNAEFRVLDGERLDLADASVDGVLCRFGYMLMSEPLRALRETKRVLRPGGRLAFSTWGDPARNLWMTFSAGVMIERGLMEPVSPDGPGMFSMSNPDTIVALARRAGFNDVDVEEMNVAWRFDDSEELWIFASELQGPVALTIAKLGDHERSTIREQIEQRAAEFARGRGYELPGLSLNTLAR